MIELGRLVRLINHRVPCFRVVSMLVVWEVMILLYGDPSRPASLVHAQECSKPKQDWIFCEDFEKKPFLGQWQEVSHRDRKVQEKISTHVFEGKSSLKLIFIPDKDGAGWMHFWWNPGSDQEDVFLRWYVKYSKGFDYGEWDVKMAGLEAHLSGKKYRPGAGFVPDGTWFQSRVVSLGVRDERGPQGPKQPFLYYYHLDQKSRWGDFGYQNKNIGITLEDDRWYCIEMHIKPNTVQRKPDGSYVAIPDGTQTLWVDNKVRAHYTKIRWRKHPEVRINDLFHSAWVGRPRSKDIRYRWEDNYVLSKSRIGCHVSSVPNASEALDN
jgi:hypothetical protein